MARGPETLTVRVFKGDPDPAGNTWYWHATRGARKVAGGLEAFARRSTAATSVRRHYSAAGADLKLEPVKPADDDQRELNVQQWDLIGRVTPCAS